MIDEAHRLRNVYKPSNVIANTLKQALAGKDKLLLTATPLQNSLLELFGLVSFIDEHTFGDLKSFREQFANLDQDRVFEALKARLKPICHRTLRRQVLPYIKYTQRLPLVEEFTPEESEDRLYHVVSEYLQRDNLQALPSSQRSLITLVLRKLLASSTFAIAGALNSMSARLKAKLKKAEPRESLEEELDQEYEALDETAEEWDEEEPTTAAFRRRSRRDRARDRGPGRLRGPRHLDQPQRQRQGLAEGAEDRVRQDSDSRRARRRPSFSPSRGGPRITSFGCSATARSPRALSSSTARTRTSGQNRSTPTGWSGMQGTDRVTGSRSADMRSALVDYFREKGRIMIATEAGAEGINLQFCSLVVNYDLPWNPQRIEQRIGRCHRYGQQHDVVVVNFLNRKNDADRRVFELLSREVQALRGRVRRERRGPGRDRIRRGLREAYRGDLPALPANR